MIINTSKKLSARTSVHEATTAKLIKASILVVLCIGLMSCANSRGPAYQLSQGDKESFETPMREPKQINARPVEQLDNGQVVSSGDNQEPAFYVSDGPSLSPSQQSGIATETVMPRLSSSKMIERLAFNNMPVGVFINEVFGNQLGLSFIVQPQVKQADDLVTMRLATPLSQQGLYKVATQTLESYGVTTSVQDDILTFGFSADASAGDTPLLISGRALPDVPSTNRPLFYVYPLTAVTTPAVRNYLLQLFKRNELTVNEDSITNSLILIGNKTKIEQAVAAIKIFDRPSMANMQSRVITPTVSSARELATNLESILQSEGFSVRQGGSQSGAAIRLLPLESSGQLVVFARSLEVAEHVLNWVEKIEVKQQSEIEQGLFSYQVQSTLASHIVGILNNLGVANAVGVNANLRNQQNGQQSDTQNQGFSQQGQSPNSLRTNNNQQQQGLGRFTVDESLNTILFSGSGKQWLQIAPIIKRLDKPAPSVMVEVILVEVQLNENEDSGVEWLANSSVGDYDLSFGTLGRLGLEASGFGLSLNSAGATRAVINAFYENRRADIRSRPRIMVKSGGEASIDVGNEIPIITSQAQGVQNPDAPIVNNISYRKTGVILDIKPTVHASGFVDIAISQELSEAADSGDAQNPTILNRSIDTTVTLRDGGSVLIGGLISSTSSDTERGVPVLGKLPLIGKLFRSDGNEQVRTELMVMIIPYILNSPDEAESLTDELQRNRLQSLELSN